MKFTTREEVKTWLRGLPLLKKDLEMKSMLYNDLARYSRVMGEKGSKHEAYYHAQIERLHTQIQQLALDTERLMEVLDPEEKAVLTARYVRRLMWDAMEFHVHYSRRQAIRVHDTAIKKLVGQEVGCDVYRGTL